MQNYFAPILILLLLLPSLFPPPQIFGWAEVQEEEDPAVIIRKVATEFSAFTGPTVDLMETFVNISKRSAHFIKWLGPLSSLAAMAMEMYLDPQSPELKAIGELHKIMVGGFADLTKQIEQNAHEMRLGDTIRVYDRTVTDSIRQIDMIFQKVTSPTENRTEWKDDFIRKCQFDSTPRNALIWLENVLNNLCHMPTKLEASLHANAVEMFMKIESNCTQCLMDYEEEYVTAKMGFIRKIARLPFEEGKFLLTRLKKAVFPSAAVGEGQLINNTLEIVDSINDALGHAEPDENCLLSEIVAAKKWQRSFLYRAADNFRKDLLKLTLIQATCINITTQGSPSRTKAYFEELHFVLNGVAAKVSKWIPAKLATAWPDIVTIYARAKIPQTPAISQYNKLATEMMSAVDDRSPTDFVHQVFITTWWDNSSDWLVAWPCQKLACIKLISLNGINGVIYRYRLGSYNGAASANTWFQEFSKRISKLLKKDCCPPLEKYLDEMRKEFALTAVYNEILFLHNRERCGQAKIDMGISSVEVHGIEPYNFIDYFIGGFCPLERSFRYELYFLIADTVHH